MAPQNSLHIIPDWVDNVDTGWIENRDILQFDGTILNVSTISDNVAETVEYKFTNVSKADEYYITYLFNNICRGALNRLWLPLWKNAFLVTKNIIAGDGIIEIRNQGYSRLAKNTRYVFFLLSTYEIISYRIDAILEIDAYKEAIVLHIAIDRNINIEAILFLGKYFLARFSDDEISFKFSNDTASQVTLKFIELPNEYDEEESES